MKSSRSSAVVAVTALMLGAVALGCGKSSKREGNDAGARIGEGGSGLAGAGGTAGGAGGVGGNGASGGTSAASGGLTSAGGAPSEAGASGEAAGDAGTTAAGSGGTATGGASGQAGGTGRAGSDSGGSLGMGGMTTCTACGPHESCWSEGSQARCVATPVHLPTGLAIDSTEVTHAQYAGWLATSPAVTGQADVCAWNESFAPDRECMAKPAVCQGDACGTHPQPCIDLCDAEAYCASTGARLCTRAEWTSACSSDGMYPAAYGETFVAGTCNDYTVFSETTVPVASKAGCQAPDDSGFAGVFDLIGNVAEWVDDCNAEDGARDVCNPRGLSFGLGAAAPTCSQSTYAERSGAADNLGFRCCSAAP